MIITATTAIAQDPDFGLKLGLNLASFTGNDARDQDRQSGLVGGVYFDKKIGGATTFRAEILYTQKGNHNDSLYYDDVFTIRRHIDYIEVPLLIKLHPQDIGDLNIFVTGGLNPAFKLTGQESTQGPEIDTTTDIEHLSAFDLGFSIGWGMFICRGKHRTTFEMRFTQGMDSCYESGRFLNIKNSVISFMLSTNFRQIV